MKMGSFLSVARGSVEPPVFLEIEYKGRQSDSPLALVGKGVTFDTYELNIKVHIFTSSRLFWKMNVKM